jgi:hypothetical protein
LERGRQLRDGYGIVLDLLAFVRNRGTEMRRMTATAVAIMSLSQVAAMAHDRLPSAEPPRSLTSRLAEMLPVDVVPPGDRLVFMSAGVLFAGLTMNFVSGGMVAALLGIGASNVPVTSVAAFAATEATWHATVWGIGPAAVLSVGQPVDAALRDPYATPGTFAGAFEESGRRAEALAVKAGTYVSATVGSWFGGR